jgi:hypothetical protein
MGAPLAGLSVVASSAKETNEKTPTIQRATRGKKTCLPKDRTISVMVMDTLSLLPHASGSFKWVEEPAAEVLTIPKILIPERAESSLLEVSRIPTFA